MKKTAYSVEFFNSSVHNVFSQPSSSPEDISLCDFSKDHNRAIIENVINAIFDKKSGITEISSSYCSSDRSINSKYSTDNRLKYWMSVLEDRKKLTNELKAKIGKKSEDVLFNYQTTVEERNKSNIRRVLDYADRMDPVILGNKKILILPEKCACVEGKCIHIRSIEETLPKPEKQGTTSAEMIGLPNFIKKEILGMQKIKKPELQSNFLKSKILSCGIQQKKEKIDRVLEYFPDIDNLIVVGESMTKKHLLKYDGNIQMLENMHIAEISSDTLVSDGECVESKIEKATTANVPDYCLLINDIPFDCVTFQNPTLALYETKFKCEPYHYVIKFVLHLKNIGMKVLSFDWLKQSYYDNVPHLLKSKDNEFYFDKRPFRLLPGEECDIIIKYQPRSIGIVKEKWYLKIKPLLHCFQTRKLQLNFKGICRPCPEYVAKLQNMQITAINKSNWLLLRKLTKGLAELTPLIKSPEVLCPYKRELDERELFDEQNKGYKCERYHDLHLLKEIYNRLKVPREPFWDLKVITLKNKILAIESAEERSLVFSEMMGILETMKGAPITWEKKLIYNPERNRAIFIYVRGTICSAIDEWEELVLLIEKSFYQTLFREYLDRLFNAAEEEEYEEKSTSSTEEHLLLKDEEEVRLEILKHLRYNKSFHDALYINTFSHLCNIAEDIVSIIESTELL